MNQISTDMKKVPKFIILFLQPYIRERAVSALKACLQLVAEREGKETVNTHYYEVSYDGCLSVQQFGFQGNGISFFGQAV